MATNNRKDVSFKLSLQARDADNAEVQVTNDHAAIGKFAAVQKGYYQDEFLQHFVPNPVPKSPIMNRGNYARAMAMRKVVDRFVQHTSHLSARQIINLGAGFDTTFLNLVKEGKEVRVVEVDMPAVVTHKCSLLLPLLPPSSSPSIISHNNNHNHNHNSSGGATADENNTHKDCAATSTIGLKAKNYLLLAADLRDLHKLDELLIEYGVDYSIPTLFISECVLVYLAPDHSLPIVKWAATKFQESLFVIYEQILPNDPFGKMMTKNLQQQGCPLLSINAYPTLAKQEERFLQNGWQKAKAHDMLTVYATWLDPTQNRKIERLEIFDEMEEWNLLLKHYCVVTAAQSKATDPSAWLSLVC